MEMCQRPEFYAYGRVYTFRPKDWVCNTKHLKMFRFTEMIGLRDGLQLDYSCSPPAIWVGD